jgi:hypothetical protein
MAQIAPHVTTIALPAATPARHPEERLPIGQSVLLILGLSLGLWASIGFGLRWLLS